MKRARLLTIVLALTPAPWALAQQPDAPRGRFPSVKPDEVRQKLQLVEALLTKSPVMVRIAESGNEQAKYQASAAQKLYQRARDAMTANDMAIADGHLNDALRLMGEASRSVPDPKQTFAEQRAKYAHLTQQIEQLHASYQKIQEREEVKALKAKAQPQAGIGDYKSALQTMREAIDYLQKALQSVGIVVPQTMAE
ncbi:MAG: hypothetical protein H0U63_06485 [Burkholderiales bacterium]|nr:hypothetical protein [Burkholderiales bacterium]